MKRLGMVLLAAAAVGAISGLGVAFAQQPSTPSASVTPERGSPRTHFTVSFTAPATGGGTMDRYEVAASVRSGRGCTSSALAAQLARRGTRSVRVTLAPSGIGHWCSGTYRGTVRELIEPSCPPRELCPDFIAVETIDTVTFAVKAPPLRSSAGAPAFGGLRTASVVCSGTGPAYRLSWNAASSRETGSRSIVYDVFASHTPRGEDFATPTWTSAPAAISFTTPQLAVGTYYFVVRARNRAGHEDHNRVQRKGAGGCSYPGAADGR